MLRPRFGVVADWKANKPIWFGGYAKGPTGEEVLRTTTVHNPYEWNLSAEFRFTLERAEREALLLAAKYPEFIGRLSIVRIKKR